MKKLTIIDTFGLFFRNYYALPYLKSRSGFPTGLLTGFINFIATIEKEHDSDYLLFALDSKTKTIRKEIDPNYKANRSAPPEDLLTQLPVAIELIKKMGFKTIEVPRYEADDIIATVAYDAHEKGMEVEIVSSDKDLYQLVKDSGIIVYDPMKKIHIDEQGCFDKFGVKPCQIVDYLAIVGDSADNIPGVKGIGDKGAKTLLTLFSSLTNIYENIENIPNKRSQKLLQESRENAFLSYKLASLYYDIVEDIDYDEYLFPKDNPLYKIEEELNLYDMQRVLSRIVKKDFQVKEEVKENNFTPILLDTKEKLFEVINAIPTDTIVALDTETTSIDVKVAKIVGFSFSYDEQKAYYVPINHFYLGVGEQVNMEIAKEAIQKLFSHKIVGQNLKYDFAVLYKNFGFRDLIPFADTMIMGWLLDSSSSIGLDSMAKRFFSHDMVKFKDVVKKGEDFSSVDIEQASLYASEDAWMSYKLYNFLSDKLETNIKDTADKVEFPFISTLISMEEKGIKIDIPFFENLLTNANRTIEQLTTDIYKLSGCEFNINSPKQLGVILFETLELKKGKKTKTGYSTDEKVLNGLKDEHPVIEKLLEYRESYKLRSTYIEPLLKLAKVDDEARIFTSFLQTGTTTGRLSSKNPNLQNIPTRTPLGRKIREGFIAREGYKLLSIDYSQIELRLLAHFSHDEALVDAFNHGKDIHLETAIKIFGEDEAKEKRAIAKTINFGLLYGMGSRKLSQTLGITTSEAKEYIDSYFKSFATVKSFLDSVIEGAKEDGYVKTLLNRKRMFDYESANAFVKASFDRESVNTLFQGSAADLIKLSMNKFEKELVDDRALMLLQIHDELIFEVKEDYIKEFAPYAKELMQNIYKLDVPLECTVNIGDNWGQLK